jgi:hypothetical protein
MGASGWYYFVPYQPDIQAALDTLRQQVFENRDYHLRRPYWLEIKDDEAYIKELFAFWHEEKWNEERAQEIRDELARFRALGDKPKTIAEAIEWNAEDGTHSILDIDRISDHVELFAIAPLSSSELIEIFGTERPTHEMIIEYEDIVMDLRRNAEGTYIIIYKDDQPDEIFFAGFSGD